MKRAIKGLSAYEHRVYTGDRPFILERRGSTERLELADDFYIRRATSSKRPSWRVVMAKTGETIIYTIDGPASYAGIITNSEPYDKMMG